MPRPKRTERKEMIGQTRHALLQAATDEFAREGYARANINRISQAAGFAKGTVYNYFDSKRALMLALIDEIARAHIAFIADQVALQDNPARRLERFFEAGLAWVTDNVAQARVIITTLNGPDIDFKLHMYEAYQPMFRLVGEEILAAGIEQGTFRRVDPSAARLVMTIYLSVCSQLNEQGKLWFSADQVTDLILNGLLAETDTYNGG